MEERLISGFETCEYLSDIYPKYEIEDWTIIMEHPAWTSHFRYYTFIHTQDPPFVPLFELLSREEYQRVENFEERLHIGLDGVEPPKKLHEIFEYLRWDIRSEDFDVLIVPTHDYESEKTRAAKKKGVPVQTLFEFCWAYLWPRNLRIREDIGPFYIRIPEEYADKYDRKRISALQDVFEYVFTTIHPVPSVSPDWRTRVRKAEEPKTPNYHHEPPIYLEGIYMCMGLDDFDRIDAIKNGTVIIKVEELEPPRLYVVDHSKTPPFVPFHMPEQWRRIRRWR